MQGSRTGSVWGRWSRVGALTAMACAVAWTPRARAQDDEEDEDWDGRVAQVVMTDVTSSTVQVRALVSASDSGKAWNLRCRVRERLVAFIRDQYPQALPRLRAELSPLPSSS